MIKMITIGNLLISQKKVLIVIAVEFLEKDVKTKGILAFIIVYIYGFLSFQVKPYTY